MSAEKQLRHKFDVFDEVCTHCGVFKRLVPIVASGYNFTMINKFVAEYSTDGVNFKREYINCIEKKKKK